MRTRRGIYRAGTRVYYPDDVRKAQLRSFGLGLAVGVVWTALWWILS